MDKTDQKAKPSRSKHPPYFTADSFVKNDLEPFRYGFFGRVGGGSKGVYNSLNCGLGSGDASHIVQDNLARVAGTFDVDPARLFTLYQIHSDQCVIQDSAAGRSPEQRPQADAHVSDTPNVALGILTADCAPVLFAGVKEDGAPVIGAAHAGWKGALSGVLGNTVDAMVRLGANRASIRACIGPCIAQPSYEVDETFAGRFMDDDDANERFFKSSQKDGHYLFDLPGYAAARLFQAGLSSVTLMDMDTYAREEDFFSYRRKTHRNEADYGRQISVIMIPFV